MIKSGEIQKRARVQGVRDTQIEKDYILSWILFGISQYEELSKVLVFKGGTVLKKVFFKEWTCNKKSDKFSKTYATYFKLLTSSSTSLGVL